MFHAPFDGRGEKIKKWRFKGKKCKREKEKIELKNGVKALKLHLFGL